MDLSHLVAETSVNPSMAIRKLKTHGFGSGSPCAQLLQETSLNIFNDIPVLAKPILSRLWDKLTVNLSSDPEYVDNVLGWWYKKQSMYPHLSCMALDYLTIPSMYSCLNKTDNYWAYIWWVCGWDSHLSHSCICMPHIKAEHKVIQIQTHGFLIFWLPYLDSRWFQPPGDSDPWVKYLLILDRKSVV